MKTKHLLLSLLALLGSTTLHASDAVIGGIHYNFSGDEATVTFDGLDFGGGNYVISSYYADKIFNIPESVTYQNKTYRVTSIGLAAFEGCSIEAITIPTSVTSIGNNAFRYCSSLTSITIPSSVTSIGTNAFGGCTFLTSVTINSNTITSATRTSSTSMKTVFGEQVRTYIIGNDVTSVGNYAFYGCSNITSINIGSGVTSIGTKAFSGCTSLTTVTLNSNAIVSATRNFTTSMSSVFGNQVRTYIIGSDVTSIGACAFCNCSGMTSVNIPNCVTSIGENAFYGCSGLTSLTIPNRLSTIMISTFRNCSGLTSITIPESVTSIQHHAFEGCSLLADITFSSNLNHIGYEEDDDGEDDGAFAFDGTSWYNNQPDGIVYAGNVAYRYKGAMLADTEITLREGTLGIGEGAFEYCGNLTSITIPESVTLIGSDAFAYCSGLTSVTIGSGVTRIGTGAFSTLCISLTSVTCLNETPPSLRSGSFTRPGIATLYVPAGSKSAYQLADYWNEFNEIVELPVDVTIGSTGYATFCSTCDLDFSGVSGLKAYIASGFSPSTGKLVLTRVDEVPAGEGLYLVGDEGTYEVPTTTTDMLYSNFLKGVTTATTISPTEGSYTNFILSTGSHGVGFYTLSSSGELAAGKAYLQLPTASVSNVKAIRLAFDDDDPTALQNIEDYTTAKDIYNLQGQKVSAPGNGLYIINGKKILFK